MYGPRGQGHFLGKATTVIAATFMFTSITLAFYSRPNEEGSSETVDAIRKLEQSDTQLAVGSANADKDRQDALNQPMSMNFDKGMEGSATDGNGTDSEGFNNTLPGLPEDFQSLSPEQQQVVLEQLLQQTGPTGLPSDNMPMVDFAADPSGTVTDELPDDGQDAVEAAPTSEGTVSTTSDSEAPSTTIDSEATE